MQEFDVAAIIVHAVLRGLEVCFCFQEVFDEGTLAGFIVLVVHSRGYRLSCKRFCVWFDEVCGEGRRRRGRLHSD
jgi:hypothetical protein